MKVSEDQVRRGARAIAPLLVARGLLEEDRVDEFVELAALFWDEGSCQKVRNGKGFVNFDCAYSSARYASPCDDCPYSVR